jgi:hypothetical protein
MIGSDEQGNGTAGRPIGMPYDTRRQADLYWRQIEQLKGAAVYIRLYRNRTARRVRTVEIVKAVASSGAIAGWFASDSYKLLWGCIIAAAQLLDVLKDVFPFAKLHKQAASITVALELLLIDAEDEWEKIHVGKSRTRISSNGARGFGNSNWKPSRNTSRRGLSLIARSWPWQPRKPEPTFSSPTISRLSHDNARDIPPAGSGPRRFRVGKEHLSFFRRERADAEGYCRAGILSQARPTPLCRRACIQADESRGVIAELPMQRVSG